MLHNLVWIFGDSRDAEISPFSAPPLGLIYCNTGVSELKGWPRKAGVS